MILVDDFSSDPQPEVVEKFICDNHLRYIRHEQNKGLASARNTAITLASGEHFTFCDDDDQWPENFAEKIVEAIKKSPADVGMSMVLAESSRPQCQVLLGEYPLLSTLMKQGFTPPGSSQLYKTELLRTVGGYNINVKSGVDHDLWVSLASIDPRVAICWAQPAIIGSDPCVNRMTADEERRREGIGEALEIWKPKIVHVFGETFYKHFCYSYEQYLDYKFFIQDIRQRNYSVAARNLFKLNLFGLVARAVFNKVIDYHPCNFFSAYKEP